jgi:glutathione S-transferase
MCYAPAFMRFDILDRIEPLGLFVDLPKLKVWSKTLLALESVKKSVVPEFEELFIELLRKKEGYWSKYLS